MRAVQTLAVLLCVGFSLQQTQYTYQPLSTKYSSLYHCVNNDKVRLAVDIWESQELASQVAHDLLLRVGCDVELVKFHHYPGAQSSVDRVNDRERGVDANMEVWLDLGLYDPLSTPRARIAGPIGYIGRNGWYTAKRYADSWPNDSLEYWQAYMKASVRARMLQVNSTATNYTCLDTHADSSGCKDGRFNPPQCQPPCFEILHSYESYGTGHHSNIVRGLNLSASLVFFGIDQEAVVTSLLEDHTTPPFFFTYWQPSVFISDLPVKRILLPENKYSGCTSNSTFRNCDFEELFLLKAINNRLEAEAPIAFQLLRRMQLTDANMERLLREQQRVAGEVRAQQQRVIEGDRLSDSEARALVRQRVSGAWLDANHGVWQHWVPDEALRKHILIVRSCSDSSATPFVMPSNSSFNRWNGFDLRLWEALAAEYISFGQLGDLDWPWLSWQYGAPLPLEDLLDSVRVGETHVALCGLGLTPDRLSEFDFSSDYMLSNLRMAYMPQGDIVGMVYSICTAFLLFAFSAVLGLSVLFGHVVWLIERNSNHDFPREYLPGALAGFWWAFVTVTTIGYGDKVPKTKVGQFVALVWMLFGLLFFSALTGSVTSVLVSNQGFGTRERASFGKLPIAVVPTSFNRLGLTLPTQYTNVVEFDTLQGALAALVAQQVDGVAHESAGLQHFTNGTDWYTRYIISEWTIDYPQPYAFAVPKGVPWKRTLDTAILSFIRQGVTLDRLTTFFFGRGLEGRSAGMDPLRNPYFMFMAFIVIGTTVVVCVLAAFFSKLRDAHVLKVMVQKTLKDGTLKLAPGEVMTTERFKGILKKVTKMGEAEIDDMIRKVDKDGNGQLDAEEVADLIERTLAPKSSPLHRLSPHTFLHRRAATGFTTPPQPPASAATASTPAPTIVE